MDSFKHLLNYNDKSRTYELNYNDQSRTYEFYIDQRNFVPRIHSLIFPVKILLFKSF